jgi:hypothetical protein
MARNTELVTNGAFTTDASWTKGDGWTIDDAAADKADSDGTQSADSNLFQDIGVVRNRTYLVSLDYTRTAGSFSVLIGGTESGQFSTASASIANLLFVSAGTDANVVIRADATYEGTIDNVSVVEIVPLTKHRTRYAAVITGFVEWLRNRY